MLKPVLGEWATVLFGIGLFAAGATSTITAPLAAAYASSGILGWGEDLKSGKFRMFWIIVIAFGIGFYHSVWSSPTEIILFAQAANAFLLPITGDSLAHRLQLEGYYGQIQKWLDCQCIGNHRRGCIHFHCGQKSNRFLRELH